jgi:hypothetical protein
MTLHEPLVAQHPTVSWLAPASGVWVASRRGAHLGLVERMDGRYVAVDGRGRTVGAFDDLDAARHAVDRIRDLDDEDALSRIALARGGVAVAVASAVAVLAATALFMVR